MKLSFSSSFIGACRRRRPVSSLVLAALLAAFPAATLRSETVDTSDDFDDDAELVQLRVSDPLERVNRGIFAFNEKLYAWIFRPVARGYVRVVPEPGRRGVGNFFENLGAPVRIVNSALQAKPTRAGKETGKLVVNSVLGLGGVLKMSDRWEGLRDVPEEDLGQTLGVWRIGRGPYLVLPVFGPSTLRDAVGDFGDGFLDPLEWELLEKVDGYDWTWTAALEAVDIVQSSPERLAAYDAAREGAIDPYIALRSAYVQNRDAETRR